MSNPNFIALTAQALEAKRAGDNQTYMNKMVAAADIATADEWQTFLRESGEGVPA